MYVKLDNAKMSYNEKNVEPNQGIFQTFESPAHFKTGYDPSSQNL